MRAYRLILLLLFGLALLPGAAASQTAGTHRHAIAVPAIAGSVADPFAPVYLVTSRKLFEGRIDKLAREGLARRDSLGTDLVIVELRAHQLEDASRLVHERENRCGGFFAFASLAEAEAFIRTEKSGQAVRSKALAAYPIDNQATVARWLPQVQETNIRATIHHLSTGFPNRYFESVHGHNAAVWIRDRWLALGRGRADVSAELFTACANCGIQPSVILTVRGSELPNEIVVVGAHLDSISNVGLLDAMIAPGADDDGSGIATLTEVIRIALAGGWRPRRTVKFMGYAAEEVGLRGSYAIARNFRNQGRTVVGVLQLDMTNYAAGSTVAMRLITDFSNGPLQLFVSGLFDEYLAPLGLTRATYACGYACSDHAAWTASGYPAAMMIEPTFFPWLHTTYDTLPRMGGTAASSVNFAKLALAFVGELGKTGTKAASDFNGDRRSDVLWRNAGTGANWVWESARAETARRLGWAAVPHWRVVGVADFDGDVAADVFWRNAQTGANVIWRSGNSATAQQLPRVANLEWAVAATDDFDGDGRADVFWRNGRTGANVIWRSANAATQQEAQPVTNLDWKIAGTGDFDGDGKADLLWRNAGTGENVIWRSANATTPQAMSAVTNLAWQVAGIGDFDTDFRADLVWRNTVTGAHSIWKAASSARQQAVAAVQPATALEGTGDYNGDGRDDLLWRNPQTGQNWLWMSGNPANALVLPRLADPNWTIVP